MLTTTTIAAKTTKQQTNKRPSPQNNQTKIPIQRKQQQMKYFLKLLTLYEVELFYIH